MLTIDGSHREGGGQILRTALALSLTGGIPFRLKKIRAGRPRPGLRRQHLAAVNAAAEISGAKVTGNTLGSGDLTFSPGKITPGDYRFSIGSSGSTILVLETVLPALLLAPRPSGLILQGGTHNWGAPPFDFLERALIPLVGKMGGVVSAKLERAGFSPAGGGILRIRINGAPNPRPLDLSRRGKILRRSARAQISHLPRHVAERELSVIRRRLSWSGEELKIEEVPSNGPGNTLVLEIESAGLTEVFTAFGRRGLPAENVAEEAARQAGAYLDSGAAVGEHLADQLLVPMAVLKGGVFSTLPPSRHTRTNIDIIKLFHPAQILVSEETEKSCLIRVET